MGSQPAQSLKETAISNAATDQGPRPFVLAGHGDLEIVGDEWTGGASVLLLHGGGQNRHAWKATARRLAAAGYAVAAVDARGHGDSGWSADGDYDIAHFGQDVLAILERFDEPPVVVGASLGGMSALAAQGLAERQLFSSVILVDVTPRMELSGVSRIMGFMAAHPEGFPSLEAAAETIAAYNPNRERSGEFDGLRKVLLERDGRWHWRWDPAFITSKVELMSGDPNALAERMDAMAADLHTAAAKLTVPTLVVRGGQSELVSVDAVQEFLAEVPHASYVDVSGAGHMVAGDDNDTFSTAVLDFLREHVPAGTHEAELLTARTSAAAAVRHFGHALVHHDADLDLLTRVTNELETASASLQDAPVRDRLAEILASDRMKALLNGAAPPTTAEGQAIDISGHLLIGGSANPFGVDATYVRDGDEVVAHAVLGAAFEGPPGRAHGGMVSAIVDETMTALMTQLGTIAFTASLQLDYTGPAPLHADLEFRARLHSRDGRRITITCSGSSGGDTFIEATGTFVEIDSARMMSTFGRPE